MSGESRLAAVQASNPLRDCIVDLTMNNAECVTATGQCEVSSVRPEYPDPRSQQVQLESGARSVLRGVNHSLVEGPRQREAEDG